jgi:hypothetical protein
MGSHSTYRAPTLMAKKLNYTVGFLTDGKSKKAQSVA